MTFEEMQIQSNASIEREYIRFKKTKSGAVRQYNTALAAAYKQSVTEIKADLKNLYAELAGLEPDQYYDFVLKYNRLTKLQKQAQDAYIRASKKAGVQIERQGWLAMKNQYYQDQYALSMASPEINTSFTAIPEALVEATVLQTEEVWKGITKKAVEKYGSIELYRARNGQTLTGLLLANRQKELTAIRTAITQGMIQGKSYQKTARLINDIATTGYNNALRIARTEGHRNQQAGHYAMSQAAQSEGVDARRMIISVLDNRTRAQSAKMDGQKEDKDGMFKYPNGQRYAMPGNTGVPKYDINDRETTVLTIEGMEPEERIGVDPTTGQKEIFSYKNFDKWATEKGLEYNRYGELVNKIDKK